MADIRRFFAAALAAAFLVSSAAVTAYADGETAAVSGKEQAVGTSVPSYEAYLSSRKDVPFGKEQRLNGAAASALSGGTHSVGALAGEPAVVIPDTGAASWSFSVPEDCLYTLRVHYIAAEKGSGNLELGLKLDGKVPFSEVSVVNLRRTFAPAGKKFEKNSAGNDIVPELTELSVWSDSDVYDQAGYQNTPVAFFCTAGTHTLQLIGSRGTVGIGSVTLMPRETPVSYRDYLAAQDETVPSDAAPIRLEAEHPDRQSSVTVLPDTDRSSAATSPQSATELRLNVMGGSTWKNVGESVSWDFEVSRAGMYEIALRCRQDLKDGIFTSRKLLLDGECPFAEAAAIRFRYENAWRSEKLGDEKQSYRFYLSEGKHTLTLEAVSGDVADMVSTVGASLNKINTIYRRIVMITGTSPDPYRDYHFKELIPDEIRQIGEIADKLQQSVDYIDRQAGATGSYTSIIKKVIFQLRQIHDQPRDIARYLEQLKSNLGSMSSWLLSATEQPLKIDCLTVLPAGTEPEPAEAGFFKRLSFSVGCFLSSYTTDYAVIGKPDSKDALKLWIQSGRDQGEVIRQLIDSDYAETHDTSVQLEIVAGGTLLSSVLAGQAPDLVFDNGATEPVNYALRGAVADLSRFDDFDTVAKWFPEAALRPARLNGGVYGLPQTFGFQMMFYRTDIFEEFGFTPPATWEDLLALIPAMQRNSLEFGMPHDLNAYTMFLYQNGGELYREDGALTNLDSNVAINTFVDFTELFTLYDMPVTFDFANRFRTGEMPCAIQDYSVYNQLTAFAPEIKGLWKMIPIPGTRQKDGTVNNVAVGTATFIMLLEDSPHKDAGWDFMKWFMSVPIQSSYAVRMESILGTCAKVATANTEALKQMTWSSSEYKNLLGQLENVNSVPEVPGGYYLTRILTFAFNRVYNSSATQNMGEEPSEVIVEYVAELNDEIARKREEFGLGKGGEKK